MFYRRRKMKAVAAQASPAPSPPSATSWVEIAPTGESDRGRRLQGKPGFSQCREVREDPGEGRTREVCLLTREAQEEGLQEAGGERRECGGTLLGTAELWGTCFTPVHAVGGQGRCRVSRRTWNSADINSYCYCHYFPGPTNDFIDGE